MANLKNYYTEITISVVMFFWLWFVSTNANFNLGSVYLWAIGISLFLLLIDVLIFDKHVNVTYQKKKGGTIEAAMYGAGGWVLLLVISFFMLKFVDPAKASLGAIMSGLNAANPVFANSVIVNLLTISFAIGYGETQLFARVLEFISDKFHIQINRSNMRKLSFIVLTVILATGFAILHITAKGVHATTSLLIVGIMMFISIMMIAYFDGETRQAVWLHWIANFVAGYLALTAGGVL